MRKGILLTDIIIYLGSEIKTIYGNPEGIEVLYLKDPQNVDRFTMDWISSNRIDKQKIAIKSKAKAILSSKGLEYTDYLKEQDKVLLIVENPKLTVAKIGNKFFSDTVEPGIDCTAVIHKSAKLGKNIFIGPNVVIGNCTIGDNVIIHANVTMYNNVTIKENVLIHSGAVIGTDGLGCERERSGKLIKFPHFGGVVINNDVEIGAHCQIARGSLSDTIIGKGSKINAGCYIGHNVFFGENVWISPQAKLAGSVRVNDNATIFTGATIKEHKVIGYGAIIGMGAVVTKDVPSGEVWIGNPAKKYENEG